jgi:hypothetical protein
MKKWERIGERGGRRETSSGDPWIKSGILYPLESSFSSRIVIGVTILNPWLLTVSPYTPRHVVYSVGNYLNYTEVIHIVDIMSQSRAMATLAGKGNAENTATQ